MNKFHDRNPSPVKKNKLSKQVEKFVKSQNTRRSKMDRDKYPRKLSKLSPQQIQSSEKPRWRACTFCNKLPWNKPSQSQEIMTSLWIRQNFSEEYAFMKKPFLRNISRIFLNFSWTDQTKTTTSCGNPYNKVLAFLRNQQVPCNKVHNFREHQWYPHEKGRAHAKWSKVRAQARF